MRSEMFNNLVEYETRFYKIVEAFKDAALYSVHYILNNYSASLNLYNLYGDDGEKFIAGGLLIRRAKDWMVSGMILSS